MIDLLSSAGRHEEIAKLWSRAKNDGFGFDSDNWNHLAASMARAGQLEEALSVVEHVLHHNPPNAWMRPRLGMDASKSGDGQEEGAAPAGPATAQELEDARKDALQQDEGFDPLPSDIILDPATAHRSDAASPPSLPPNRRHQARSDDDPYVELPFEVPDSGESMLSAEEDGYGGERLSSLPNEVDELDFTEPSAFYLDSEPGFSLTRDLKVKAAETFSPWYAHFETMEAISRGLADLREAHKVIGLLDKYPAAASLLDLHERKVEIIRERQKEEAVRSARDLIDGRN